MRPRLTEQERRERARVEREAGERIAKREQGWEGRAGGMEVRKPEPASGGLPSLERSSSAPGSRSAVANASGSGRGSKTTEQRLMASPLLSPVSPAGTFTSAGPQPPPSL